MRSSTSDTRTRIASIAVERFLAQGPAGVSMREIAKVAGITPMAIYRHFPDKEALLLAVLNEGFRLYADYLRVGDCVTDPVERLRQLAARVFDFAIDKGAYFELMFLTSRTAEGLADRAQIQAIYTPTYRVAREALRACYPAGQKPTESLRDSTNDVLAYCIGFCAFYISGGLAGEPDAAKRQFMRGFDRLVRRILADLTKCLPS